jgi:hypothetical protein
VVLDGRVRRRPRLGVDDVLAELGVAPLRRRTPVIAVGSNASPAQLRAKLGPARLVVPLTRTRTHGIAVGVSAHVSRPGYVPATPVPAPGEFATLFALWLDEEQLAVMDATEPNYDRVPLRVPVADAADGAGIDGCQVYVSKHGHLLSADGMGRRLLPQRQLISSLLAESRALRELAGSTPESWIERMRSTEHRADVRRLWIREGRVALSIHA